MFEQKARFGLTSAIAASGFLAIDFLLTTVRFPMLWYEPLLRRFSFQTIGGGAAMDFYGRLLWCLLGGALAGAIGWLLLAGLDPQAVRRWELRTIIWLLVSLGLAGALQVTQLAQRNPVPLELGR